jgi:hypothetical protein
VKVDVSTFTLILKKGMRMIFGFDIDRELKDGETEHAIIEFLTKDKIPCKFSRRSFGLCLYINHKLVWSETELQIRENKNGEINDEYKR